MQYSVYLENHNNTHGNYHFKLPICQACITSNVICSCSFQHWYSITSVAIIIIICTVGCNSGIVKVYDSFYNTVSNDTAYLMASLV